MVNEKTRSQLIPRDNACCSKWTQLSWAFYWKDGRQYNLETCKKIKVKFNLYCSLVHRTFVTYVREREREKDSDFFWFEKGEKWPTQVCHFVITWFMSIMRVKGKVLRCMCECLDLFSLWFGSHCVPCFSWHIFQNNKIKIQSVEIWWKFEKSNQSLIFFCFFARN